MVLKSTAQEGSRNPSSARSATTALHAPLARASQVRETLLHSQLGQPERTEEDSCSCTEQGRKRRKPEGTGHLAKRVAEEQELFKGSRLTYCKSRTVITKKGITGERWQLETLEATPHP